MTELFEVVTKDEFGAPQEAQCPDKPGADVSLTATAPGTNLTWCEFCKGYYDFEYHFGDKGEEDA